MSQRIRPKTTRSRSGKRPVKGVAPRWTAADRARHRILRSRFGKGHPSQEELLASGEFVGPFALEDYVEIRTLFAELRKSRMSLGVTLAELSKRSGLDSAALSRLENGRQPNPTIETLWRYAAALGKRLGWTLRTAIKSPR